MNKQELLAMAKERGVKGVVTKRKEEIIHAIQLAEGNADCFGRIPDCGIQECIFRDMCIPC